MAPVLAPSFNREDRDLLGMFQNQQKDEFIKIDDRSGINSNALNLEVKAIKAKKGERDKKIRDRSNLRIPRLAVIKSVSDSRIDDSDDQKTEKQT